MTKRLELQIKYIFAQNCISWLVAACFQISECRSNGYKRKFKLMWSNTRTVEKKRSNVNLHKNEIWKWWFMIMPTHYKYTQKQQCRRWVRKTRKIFTGLAWEYEFVVFCLSLCSDFGGSIKANAEHSKPLYS